MRKWKFCKRMEIFVGIYQFGKFRGRGNNECKVKRGFQNGDFRKGEMSQNTLLRVAATISGCSAGKSNAGELREIENSSI